MSTAYVGRKLFEDKYEDLGRSIRGGSEGSDGVTFTFSTYLGTNEVILV